MNRRVFLQNALAIVVATGAVGLLVESASADRSTAPSSGDADLERWLLDTGRAALPSDLVAHAEAAIFRAAS